MKHENERWTLKKETKHETRIFFDIPSEYFQNFQKEIIIILFLTTFYFFFIHYKPLHHVKIDISIIIKMIISSYAIL